MFSWSTPFRACTKDSTCEKLIHAITVQFVPKASDFLFYSVHNSTSISTRTASFTIFFKKIFNLLILWMFQWLGCQCWGKRTIFFVFCFILFIYLFIFMYKKTDHQIAKYWNNKSITQSQTKIMKLYMNSSTLWFQESDFLDLCN